MREEDIKYLSEFLKEFQSETDRGAALVGAALIDDRLERLLRSHFIDGKEANDLLGTGSAPIGSFAARTKAAYCLGLITELEFKECNIIRRVRNEFAHQVHGLDFSNDKLSDLCGNLAANTPDGAHFGGDARQLFINSVILTSLALWYRPEYAKAYEAKPRQWEHQLSR